MNRPRYVDTIAAAAAVNVKPHTIRTWATRGLLERQGRDHRNRTLYVLDDVYRVASTRRRRPHRADEQSTA